MKPTHVFLVVQAGLLACLAASSAASSAAGADIEAGFTGISVDVQGAEGTDYVVERLWHDRRSDDNLVLYIKSTVPIAMDHNEDNIVAAETPWEPGMDPGTIVWKVDGDGLRGYSGNIYHAAPAYGNPINPPLDEIQFQYDGPFTLAAFKGQVGPGPDFHRGMLDEAGDEWHVLTFWDVDPENTQGNRDDQTNDGKIVYAVLDPQAPAITLNAPAGEEFYTTAPKLYYVPHIHRQTTYLTGGVEITLTNLADGEPIHYQVDDGPVETYTGPLTASALFPQADTVYTLSVWRGDGGPKRIRTVHVDPIQPTVAAGETHPRLEYPSPAELAAEQAIVAAGGPEADAILDTINLYEPPIDFRTRLRYLGPDVIGGGYYYQTKRLAGAILNSARYGVLTLDETEMRRAVDGLLFLWTIDPIGAESADSRNGGPCQERVMYSDGRITSNAAVAYDLLAGLFTREAGYPTGMTPIEHIKIRDNIAEEACMMLQFPTSIPEPFWRTSRDDGSPRNVQLENFRTTMAMAIPTYDSYYFGTSGADDVTQATHLHAPFPDTALAWITVNNTGYVQHPGDPSRFRYSPLWNLVDTDGAYVGQPRDGYLSMMHRETEYYVWRVNFDGHHYARYENYLRMRIDQRFPFNGAVMPQAFYGSGFNSTDDWFLPKLVRSDFPYAGLYRWSLEHPVDILDPDDLADPAIAPEPPDGDSRVTQNYAMFSSNRDDPNAVAMRMRVYPPDYNMGGGTFQTYLGGAINVAGYGERLVIEKAGYHRVEDYWYGISQMRKSCILINGENDRASSQVRGTIPKAILAPGYDYAEMRTDLEATSQDSSYVETGTNLTRRVLFIDDKLLILADTLDSTTGAQQFDWLLHGATGGNPAPDAYVQDNQARRAVWTKPSGVRLWHQMITDAQFNDEPLFETDYLELIDDEGVPEPYLRARTNGQNVEYLAVVYSLPAGAADPVVTPLTVANGVAAKITGGVHDGEVVVALRTGPGRLDPQGEFGLSTDALLCAYRIDAQGDAQMLAMVDGAEADLVGTPLALDLGRTSTAARVMTEGIPVLYAAQGVRVGGTSATK